MEKIKQLAKLVFLYRKFLLFAAFLFLFSAPAAQALGQYTDALNNCDVSYNKECFDTDTISDVLSAYVCAMGGKSIQCNKDRFGAGLLGISTQMIAGIYANPPASGVYYAMDRLQHLGIIQPAYAQVTGIGFNGLQPLLPIWRAFRNFSYIIFAIVFVIMGFLIMFRVQLSPQTAVTIQSAIPRIVIALLLITFSYAIVGFMIDLIYISIALVGLIFEQVPGGAGLSTSFLEEGLGGAISGIFNQQMLGLGVIGGIASIVGGAIAGWLSGALAGFIGPLIPFEIGAAGVALLGGLIFIGIVFAIIVWLLFRLFIELLISYLGLVIGLIIAPLQIAFGVIPGLPGFGAWLRAITAHALVFPVLAFIFMLARVLSNTNSSGLWHPPLFIAGGFVAGTMPLILTFGLLFIAPQVPPVVRKTLGVEGLGFNPLAAVGAGLGIVMGGVGEVARRREERKRRRAEEAMAENIKNLAERFTGRGVRPEDMPLKQE